MTAAQAPPLRVGLLSDSSSQPRWLYDVFETLRRRGVATLAVLAVDARTGSQTQRRPPLSGWLGQAFLRADDAVFRRDCVPDACARVELSPLATSTVAASGDQAASWFTEGLGADGLDVLVYVGSYRESADIVRRARLGTWVVRHGEDGEGLAEFVGRQHVTHTRLVRLESTQGAEHVLAESWSATDLRSARRQRNRLGWKARALLQRTLERAWRGDWDCPQPAGATASDQSGDRADHTPSTLSFLAGWASKAGRDKIHDLTTVEQWGLGLREDPGTDAPSFDRLPQRYIVPPADRFWADPFPIEHGGRMFVFVEELYFRQNKGCISVLELDGRPSPDATRVLEEPYHLSYPSVFKWKNDIFMTPESSAARRVDLYRARSFPHDWEKVSVLLEDSEAADPTILEVDGTWWMFVNLPLHGAPNCDECHLYWADRLEGPWHPHPFNPIQSDVRCARPAGRLFFKGGRLFRPAQDCSVRYGYATVVHEVLTLSKTAYREREVARITPVWREDVVATHTLNHAGSLTTWDCLFVRSRRKPHVS